MKPYQCSGDILNVYKRAEYSLKKLSITIRDFEPNLSDGDGITYCKILRILLLQTSRSLTMLLLKKGVNCTSGDRRIVLTTFDILRENHILTPSITPDQFLGRHFIEHKIIIIHKLSEYIYSIKQKPKESIFINRKNSPNSSNHYQESIIEYNNNLDDEEWVQKYVINHPNNNNSNNNCNNNSNNNTDDDIIPFTLHHLDVSNKSFTNSNNPNISDINNNNNNNNNSNNNNNNSNNNNSNNNINNKNLITISESDLKKMIEIEVNKKISIYNEKQAFHLEHFRKSYENLEQRLKNVEEGIIELNIKVKI